MKKLFLILFVLFAFASGIFAKQYSLVKMLDNFKQISPILSDLINKGYKIDNVEYDDKVLIVIYSDKE